MFDSGLGGLSVLAEIRRLRPDVEIVYAADDAAFPYGRLSEEALVARVKTVMARLIGEIEPDIVVVACSTASTLALPPLRAAYPHLPFVGVVPVIKPAAAASRSGLISVLATRGTVARDYTQALGANYAPANREVTLVGSPLLALIAERVMRGQRSTTRRSRARSRRASSSARPSARTRSCSPAPIFRCSWTELSAFAWLVGFVDPRPPLRAASTRSSSLLAQARRPPLRGQ